MADTRIEIEQRIVRNLVRTLKAEGFFATQVWDGGEYVKTRTEHEVLDAVFAVDDATIHFDGGKGANSHSHGVYIVLGNGFDCISDYHCGDPEFDAVLDRVNAWVNAKEAVAE